MFIDRKDVKFKASRSSGPGGQRTNRRSTKVELWVKIGDLPFSEAEKKRIRQKLSRHINNRDEIWVQDQENRSQKQNKDKALFKLNELIKEALKVPKKRIPSQPPRRAEDDRIRKKKIISEKKKMRRTSR